MATYLEQQGLFTAGTDLSKRAEVAMMVAIDVIRAVGDDGLAGDGDGFSQAAGAHDLRKTWAATALTQGTDRKRLQLPMVLRAIVTQNRASTVAQITGASDAVLQTAVNKAVDLLARV